MHLEQSGNDERISGIVVNKSDFVAKRKSQLISEF